MHALVTFLCAEILIGPGVAVAEWSIEKDWRQKLWPVLLSGSLWCLSGELEVVARGEIYGDLLNDCLRPLFLPLRSGDCRCLNVTDSFTKAFLA